MVVHLEVYHHNQCERVHVVKHHLGYMCMPVVTFFSSTFTDVNMILCSVYSTYMWPLQYFCNPRCSCQILNKVVTVFAALCSEVDEHKTKVCPLSDVPARLCTLSETRALVCCFNYCLHATLLGHLMAGWQGYQPVFN